MHIAEAEEAYDIVKAIVQGNGASIAEQNLLNVDGSGSSSHVTVGADWESGTGKVNLMQVTMVGTFIWSCHYGRDPPIFGSFSMG